MENERKRHGDPYPPLGELFDALRATGQFLGRDSPHDQRAVALFLPYVDELWAKDEFQPARFQRLIRRLNALRREDIVPLPQVVSPVIDIYKWSSELERLHYVYPRGEPTWEAIGYLVQIDRLFDAADKLKAAEAQLLITRPSSLDSADVQALAQGLETRQKRLLGEYVQVSIRQAAIMLIQADSLFTGKELRREHPPFRSLPVD